MNSKTSGPRPQFIEAQVHRALELVGECEPIGRKPLAEKLGVGEGSTRTILNRLKKVNLIKSTPQGHVLTQKGKRELKGRSGKFVKINAGNLTVGEVNVATIVKNASKKIKLGVEQRDAAIKAGAEGATILVFTDGELQFPKERVDLEKEIENKLLDSLQPNDGDVIIIGAGKNQASAERGALAAAESLT